MEVPHHDAILAVELKQRREELRAAVERTIADSEEATAPRE